VNAFVATILPFVASFIADVGAQPQGFAITEAFSSYWWQRGLNNGATPDFELFQAFGVNGAAFSYQFLVVSKFNINY
jgi:hypothetical protein